MASRRGAHAIEHQDQGRAGDATEASARRILGESVARLERLIAWGRIGVGLLALARSTVVWREVGFAPEHVLGSMSAFALAGAFSVFALWHLRRHEASGPFLLASVAADTLACGLALSTDSIWPNAQHPGLLFMPDLGALILVVAATGLRLSVAVSIFGGALSLAVLAALVWLEALRQPLLPVAFQNLSGIAGLIVGVAVVAAVIAARTRRLVREGALRAIAAERAVGNLDWLLRNHHDLRSRLSGAGLNADLLVRALPAGPQREPRRLHAEAVALRRDLDAVNDCIAEAKRRSHGELLAHKPVAPADPTAVAEGVVSLSRSLLGGLPIALETHAAAATAAPVRVAGGVEGLHYLLQQLIVEASSGAQRVRVVLRPDARPGYLAFEVHGEGGPPGAVALTSGADRVGAERIAAASGGSLGPRRPEPGPGVVSLPVVSSQGRRGVGRSAPGELTPEARSAIGSLFAATRTRGERLIAGWRVALAVLSVGRSLWVWQAVGWGLDAPPLRFALGILLVTAAFSGIVLWRVRERASPGLLLGSTLLDVGICSAALLTNVLWPEPDYRGILFMPELCAFMVPIIVSALRLSPVLTALSLALCAASLGGLVHLDLTLSGASEGRAFEHLSALFAFLVGMAITAGLHVARSRSMVEESARRGVEAQRVGRNLGLVLDRQRSAHELLATAMGRARRLSRAVEQGAGGGDARTAADQLQRDLDTVQAALAEVEARSQAELLARQALQPALLGASFGAVVGELAGRYPAVRFLADARVRGARVAVAGGAEGLQHVLQNLLVNACEGDGRRGASCVRVGVEDAADDAITLSVRDDGPGFTQPLGDGEAVSHPTTKAEGSGLGLTLVRRLVEAGGGRLVLANAPEGGACVRVRLPVA